MENLEENYLLENFLDEFLMADLNQEMNNQDTYLEGFLSAENDVFDDQFEMAAESEAIDNPYIDYEYDEGEESWVQEVNHDWSKDSENETYDYPNQAIKDEGGLGLEENEPLDEEFENYLSEEEFEENEPEESLIEDYHEHEAFFEDDFDHFETENDFELHHFHSDFEMNESEDSNFIIEDYFDEYESRNYEDFVFENNLINTSTVSFISGNKLPIVTGQTGKNQEHWDVLESGNPLLDTSGANKDIYLSKNFKAGEFARSGSKRFDKARIDPKLVEALQRLRDHINMPIKITSGYRSYGYNKALYKRKNLKPTKSQHISGKAADIKVRGMNAYELGKIALDVLGCDIGIGLYPNFLHVDVRGRFAIWSTSSWIRSNWIPQLVKYQKQLCKSGKTQKTSSNESLLRKIGLGILDLKDIGTKIFQAIRAGFDENKLTNFIFHIKFPENQGKKLKSNDPLAKEWIRIRNTVVRPLLKNLNEGEPSQKPNLGSSVPHNNYGQLNSTNKVVQFRSGRWGGWRGRQTVGTSPINKNSIKSGLDIAVAVAAEVETSGKYDKVQAYDKGILSWGIKQWTLHRGSLQKVLRFIKTELEAQNMGSLWSQLFPRIDFRGADFLIDGTVYQKPRKDDDSADLNLRRIIRGSQDKTKFNPKVLESWLKMFALAARNPHIQALQFKHARKELSTNLNQSIGTKLFRRRDIKRNQIGNYKTVSHYIGNNLEAVTFFNGMLTQNPKWTYRYLKRIIDRFKSRHRTYDTNVWPTDWQKVFARELVNEFKGSGVACWGRSAINQKTACKNRTSRSEKIERGIQKYKP